MSTMEAKLVASALAMKETVFFSNILTELGFGKEFAQMPVYCDNTATLHALGNLSFGSRTRHIALRFFFIRELVTEERISIHNVPTEDNLANVGTKHFNKHRFKNFMDLINKFDVNKFTTAEFKGKLVISLFDSVCLELGYTLISFVGLKVVVGCVGNNEYHHLVETRMTRICLLKFIINNFGIIQSN